MDQKILMLFLFSKKICLSRDRRPPIGFTLIEVLVVIIIIGILASIVLVNLNKARNKAKDARIREDLSQVRNIAEMIMSNNDDYSSLCNVTNDGFNTSNYSTQLNLIETDIETKQGGSIKCYAGPSAYCVSSTLNVGGVYCIDGTGWAGSSATADCTAAKVCTH